MVYLAMIFLVPAIVFAAAFIIYKVPVGSSSTSEDYLSQADFYYARGVYDEAAAYYEKALMIKPDIESALNNAAVIYNKVGEYSKAAEKLAQLVNINPDNPSYHYDYAVNLVLDIKQKGSGTIEQIEKAIEEFQKSDSLQNGYQKVKENLAFLEDMKEQYLKTLAGQ
jgi:tetratricopeptide (TPR) repeat protein